jgi:hypothetical protein
MGTARRVNHVHTFDRLVLDDEAAEAALNPLALSARELGAAMENPSTLAAALEPRTAAAGTVEHVIDVIGNYLAQGHSDYIMLALPAGDQTFQEAKDCVELFISDVMPKFL